MRRNEVNPRSVAIELYTRDLTQNDNAVQSKQARCVA